MSDQTTLDALVERLEEFRHRMNDNAALDYFGAQIADEITQILVDATTQNAPAESCNSDEGKDRTNNLQEEGTAMTSIPETDTKAKADGARNAPDCPAWCDRHYIDANEGYPIHKRVVSIGEISVVIETSPEWMGRDDLPIWTDEIDAVDAAGARDYAAALLEAARLMEEAK